MDGKALVREVFEVIGSGDYDRIPRLIHPEFVGHGPGAQLRGQSGFVEHVQTFREAFPDLTCEAVDIIEEGDRVSWRVVGHGTHEGELMGVPPTGRRVHLGGIDQGRLAPDGRVLEHWSGIDVFGMLMQVGAIPAPA
jgi:predicted ester cyclase